MPTVAIVILNWNGRHYLQRFLPSVLEGSAHHAEVIIADNDSTDDSVEWLEQHHPDIRIIRLPQNFGFAKGYNEALRQVQADYYVLLNSDVAVAPGWVAPVIALMEADTKIGACQPKIRMERHRNLFEYAGASGGWLDALGYPFARGRIFDICEEDLGQYNDPCQVFWASGAALFVRASVYHLCGGLDEYFFAHMEEIDLCWRMQLKGYRIMVCPAAAVYHVGGGTLPRNNRRKVYLNFRNNLIMLSKNLPLAEIWWKLPLRLVMDVLFAWKSLFSGYPASFAAVCRAHADFVFWWMRWRRKDTTSRPVASRLLTGYYSGSIVWKHFIRGRQKFSEIIRHKPV